MDAKSKAMVATWARAAIASAVGLYLAGETDPKKLGAAALAGFCGPLLKWLDPKEKEYGLGSKKK